MLRNAWRQFRTAPWHPEAFAAVWVLSAWVAASPSPYAAARALGVALAFAALLSVLGRVLFRSWQIGAIAATAVILVLTEGRDASVVADNIRRSLPWWQTASLAVTVVLAIGAAGYVTRRAWRQPNLAGRVGSYLNLVGAVFCSVIVVSGIARGSFDWRDLQQGIGVEQVERTSVTSEGPDIYVILLDGYPRADTLQETYDFDNSGFLDALQARGFWVDPASHSNYLLTEPSLTSFFNMTQLADLDDLRGVLLGDVPAQPTARRVLNDNRVFAELRARGYGVISYAIPYEGPSLRGADVFVEMQGVNEFERSLIASTFLLDLTDLVNRNAIADDMRRQILRALDEVPLIAANRTLGPRMLFAHVMAPHAPFLFDARGNPITSGLPHRHQDWVSPGDLTESEFSRLLADEIQYVNHAVLTAIDGVLAASTEPPLLVLMSDHGVRARPVDPDTMTPTQRRDAFGTLFAAYTPGREGLFKPGTTPSQVMAELFNAYFGTAHPVASTDAFISTGPEPFKLIPVPEP